MKSLNSITSTGKLVLITIFGLILSQNANAAFPHTPSGQLKNIFVPLQEREKAVTNEQATVSVDRLQRHFLLYGVISGPGGQTAMLKINPKETSDLPPPNLKDKPYIVLKKGEKLEDFTLTEITSRSAVFKRGDKLVSFQLFETDDKPERSKNPVAQATPQAVSPQIPGLVQPPSSQASGASGSPAPMMAQNQSNQPNTQPNQTVEQQSKAAPPKTEAAQPAAQQQSQFGPAPIQPPQGGDLPHASAAPPATADNPFLKALERAKANQGSAPSSGAANPFMNLMKSN